MSLLLEQEVSGFQNGLGNLSRMSNFIKVRADDPQWSGSSLTRGRTGGKGDQEQAEVLQIIPPRRWETALLARWSLFIPVTYVAM